jgi:hypothetical protein
MAKEKVVRTYEYQGRELGKLVEVGIGQHKSREFQTDLSEYEAMNLVYEMPAADQVHMRHQAHAVHRLLESFGQKPDDYVDNEVIMIHVANEGYTTLTELNRGDHRAWELVKQRGLEDELFQDVKSEKK